MVLLKPKSDDVAKCNDLSPPFKGLSGRCTSYDFHAVLERSNLLIHGHVLHLDRKPRLKSAKDLGFCGSF